MALGAGFKQLLTLNEIDVRNMRERFAKRVAGHDAVQHSPQERLVTFRRGAEELWTARAEPMARFVADMGLLRWWWYGKLASGKSRLDGIVAAGQQYGVDELTRDVVQTESLEASEVLCALAASMAGAEGVLRLQDGDDWSFFALYDAGAAKMSIAAPPIPTTVPPPAERVAHSLPPHAPHLAPSPALAPAEPARELVSPVAVEAMSLVQASNPAGFRQAMVTVVVDAQAGKARLFVHLAVCDAHGDLQSLDPSQRLFEAVVAMITEQRRRGGGDLHKLVMRLRPTERGASIDVTVA